jgi:sugar phosphate isomerase/epimerase
MNLEVKHCREYSEWCWLYPARSVRDSNRLLPGRGHTDFVSGFTALRQIGYDGYMALECQVPKNHSEELSNCVRYLRHCLDEVINISNGKLYNRFATFLRLKDCF